MTRTDTIALAAICLSSLMFGLEISSVPTILPTLATVLHADFQQLQWIMNAYTIAVTSVLMAMGTIADRYGRKRVFVVSIIVFGLASLVCGLAPTAGLLVAGRFFQGMSGGAMLICQVASLSHQFQAGPGRTKAFSAWGIVFGTGLGFGPIFGAATVALLGWQWTFLVHAVLAVITALLAIAGVRESCDPEATHLDLAGVVTLSAAVFCVAFYITQGPDLGFSSAAGVAVLGAAVLSLGGFVLAEMLSPRPMFDFAVFRIREFSGALLGSMGMNFSFWPFMIYLPLYFRSTLGYSNAGTGLALLAYTLPALIVPPLGERMLLHFQARTAIPAGLFTIGLGFMAMWAGNTAGHPHWLTILAGCLIAGTGLGLTNTPVTNTTTAAVPSTRAGMASGIDMSARMISLAINIAVMGLILVSAISAWLDGALSGIAPAQLHHIAEEIAGGQIASSLAFPGSILHAALAHGFALVMLYGALSTWILALSSRLIFGGTPAPAATPCEARQEACS